MTEDVIEVGNDDVFSTESSAEEQENDNDHDQEQAQDQRNEPEEECRHVQTRARPGFHHSHHYAKAPRKRIPTKASSTRPTTPEWRSPRNRGNDRPNYYEANQRGPYKRHRYLQFLFRVSNRLLKI